MAKNIKNSSTAERETAKKNGSMVSPASTTPNGRKLNVPMKPSEMSKSDKMTLRAWKITYENRHKRLD